MNNLKNALVEACNIMEQYAFAFSGGLSEDDLLVAQCGIAHIKSLLNE